jgi:osmotically-inducible protein OsmY
MSHNARLLSFLVLSICSLRLSAHAQDSAALKQSSAARGPSVAALIASCTDREGSNGFLTVIAASASDQARQVTTDENRDRVAIFRLIASQTGMTPDQVATLYAERAMNLNPKNPCVVSPPPPPPEPCDDLQIAKSLKDRFSQDGDLGAFDIQVIVTHGTVRLSGSVSNELDRTRATQIVESSVCPVASLVDDLAIDSDKVIAASIKSVFRGNADLRSQQIKFEVSNGNVFLNGSVCENIGRTVAASTVSKIQGVKTVTNNLTVDPSQCHSSGGSEGGAARKQTQSLTGSWTGTYLTCAQAQILIQFNITQSAPDDITADVEIQIPNARVGTFTTHGVLNTVNNFLSFQFNGWEYQPPGLIMGSIGGYVTFSEQGATNFDGIIHSPGCGRISLKKR